MQLVSLAQDGHNLSGDVLNIEVYFGNLHSPAMEGLDVAIATMKHPLKIEPEQNGIPAVQYSPSASWFSSSKSAKKPRSVIHQSLKERNLNLKKIVKPIAGKHSWSRIAHNVDVERFFKETLENSGYRLPCMSARIDPTLDSLTSNDELQFLDDTI